MKQMRLKLSAVLWLGLGLTGLHAQEALTPQVAMLRVAEAR